MTLIIISLIWAWYRKRQQLKRVPVPVPVNNHQNRGFSDQIR